MKTFLSLLTLITSLHVAGVGLVASAHANDPETVANDQRRGLSTFTAALEAATTSGETPPIRIVWFGDSAIISDGYTRVVRKALQTRYGDGGAGFVLGATTFDGYLRDGVRMKRTGWRTGSVIQGNVENGRYGLGGVVAAGGRGASLTLLWEDAPPAPVRGVDVLVQVGPKAGKLGVFVDGAKTPIATFSAESEELGDETWSVNFEAPATREVKIKVLEGAIRLYGASLEARRGGVQLDPLGILGIRARRWLNADADHLAKQIRARAPALIVVNFGGNERVDAGLTADAHQQDIVAVIAAFKRGAPSAACLVVGPLVHGVTIKGAKKLDPKLATLYAGQRAAAKAKGCAFVDTIELMGGHTSATLQAWRKKRWISGDYAHLTNSGHTELGRRLAAWLVPASPQ